MDEESKRRLWDQKYEDGLPSLSVPDPFFLFAYERFVRPSFPDAGVALDVAGGLGRHALSLAGMGWRVSVVDVSQVALDVLGREARRLSLEVERIAADVTHVEMPPERYDLILLFYHFDRTLCPTLTQALRPGGLIVTKLALEWITGSSTRRAPDSPPTRGELPTLLSGVQVLHHAERPVGHRGVVEFLGQK